MNILFFSRSGNIFMIHRKTWMNVEIFSHFFWGGIRPQWEPWIYGNQGGRIKISVVWIHGQMRILGRKRWCKYLRAQFQNLPNICQMRVLMGKPAPPCKMTGNDWKCHGITGCCSTTVAVEVHSRIILQPFWNFLPTPSVTVKQCEFWQAAITRWLRSNNHTWEGSEWRSSQNMPT